MRELAEIVADPSRTSAVPRDAIPGLLAQLEGVRALLWTRMLGRPEPSARPQDLQPDELLTAAEVAEILEVDLKWLYRHPQLPFARRLGRRTLRFSRRGLEKWLAHQQVVQSRGRPG